MGQKLTKTRFVILGGAAMGLAFAQQPAGDPVAFQTQTRLVMVPFHAARGNTNLADLSKSDVVLLEDGRPREFSIFDVPSGTHRMPVELVLLFDANPRAGPLWDPAGVYQFVKQWNDSMSAALLQSGGADVRVSVYRCAGQKLYRSTPVTSDPATLTRALRGVLTPLPSKPEPGSVMELTLPPKRDEVDLNSRLTRDYVTSNFGWAKNRGWALEAAIGLLDAMSAPDRVSRVLVIFGEGIGATTTIPEDVGEHALDLGIPIYPVATNYKGRLSLPFVPRNRFRMHQFEALGEMTGGRAVEYKAIDATLLQKILNEVKGHVLEQYVVGFAPDSNAAPSQHNLEVRAAAPASATIEGGKRRAVY